MMSSFARPLLCAMVLSLAGILPSVAAPVSKSQGHGHGLDDLDLDTVSSLANFRKSLVPRPHGDQGGSSASASGDSDLDDGGSGGDDDKCLRLWAQLFVKAGHPFNGTEINHNSSAALKQACVHLVKVLTAAGGGSSSTKRATQPRDDLSSSTPSGSDSPAPTQPGDIYHHTQSGTDYPAGTHNNTDTSAATNDCSRQDPDCDGRGTTVMEPSDDLISKITDLVSQHPSHDTDALIGKFQDLLSGKIKTTPITG